MSNYDTSGDEITDEDSENLEKEVPEPSPPEDYDGRCDFCGSLNIECLMTDYGPEGKLYDLDALVDAASRCKTCERIFDLPRLRNFTGAQSSDETRAMLKTCEAILNIPGLGDFTRARELCLV
jgi:hypothetical protein